MNMLLDEMISSTNMSFGLYPGLTANAIDAIEKSGSDELKNNYLPNLASGKWTGTIISTISISGVIPVPEIDFPDGR